MHSCICQINNVKTQIALRVACLVVNSKYILFVMKVEYYLRNEIKTSRKFAILSLREEGAQFGQVVSDLHLLTF